MRHERTGLLVLALMTLAPSASARTPQDVASPVVTIGAQELERRSSDRSLGDLLKSLPCAPRTVPTFVRPSAPVTTPTTQGALSCVQPVDLRMVEVLRVHNDSRAQFGSQPLVWDPLLAAAAQTYAVHLARTGRLVHSPREGRGSSRENLAMGMPNWSGSQLVGIWLAERRFFRPGVYPNVTTTGRWADASHFTQMMWPRTVTLGCGIADGGGHRWLVCRYAPGGNKDGVFIGPQAPIRSR